MRVLTSHVDHWTDAKDRPDTPPTQPIMGPEVPLENRPVIQMECQPNAAVSTGVRLIGGSWRLAVWHEGRKECVILSFPPDEYGAPMSVEWSKPELEGFVV